MDRGGGGAGGPLRGRVRQLFPVFTNSRLRSWQLPVVGSAQGHQVVNVGGAAVVPVPQVVQLGAVDGGVAPDASPVPDGGGQSLGPVA